MYLLEKTPNLLCYNLFVPLPDAAAVVVAAKSGAASEKLKPGMSLVKREKGKVGSPTLRMWMPEQGERESKPVLKPWLDVPLDCEVDVDRSVLSVQGDNSFLCARLAFSQYSEAANTRANRQLMLPSPEELEASVYTKEGIRCRGCQKILLTPQTILKVFHAPHLPWHELLECYTCVPAEQYRQGQGDPAFYAGNTRVKSGAAIIAETYIIIHQGDIAENFNATMAVASEEEKLDSWIPIDCSSCTAYLGDIRVTSSSSLAGHSDSTCACSSHSDKDDLKELFAEVRLHKHAITCGSLFSRYSVNSLLGGYIEEASIARECYRFVLGYPLKGKIVPCCRIVLLSRDSWVRSSPIVPVGSETSDSSNSHSLSPAQKVLFEPGRETMERLNLSKSDTEKQLLAWCKDTQAELVIFNRAICKELLSHLLRSNSLLPSSVGRQVLSSQECFRLGFLCLLEPVENLSTEVTAS